MFWDGKFFDRDIFFDIKIKLKENLSVSIIGLLFIVLLCINIGITIWYIILKKRGIKYEGGVDGGLSENGIDEIDGGVKLIKMRL